MCNHQRNYERIQWAVIKSAPIRRLCSNCEASLLKAPASATRYAPVQTFYNVALRANMRPHGDVLRSFFPTLCKLMPDAHEAAFVLRSLLNVGVKPVLMRRHP
eukprot:6205538-Pleurochrysis_carterae.AAC.6